MSPSPGRRARDIPIPGWLAAAALIAAFVLQASWAARRDSVTIDEFVHLPVGLYNLYSGDFTLDPINPPLSRMIAAAPLLVSPPAFSPDPARGHWAMGYELQSRNVDSYQDIFVRGRTMIILMASLLGVLVFAWATALYGWHSGIMALGLYCFSPSMLAPQR